ncbi:GtrA family protein [Sandarakinorhabdus sp. DWP1-3-1]|uniref:GtrA family protein n=1 Tax=Sandarakinorhabdus sp. DWP1-3-1 TaxID=2804627 RepID=UPI003CEED797
MRSRKGLGEFLRYGMLSVLSAGLSLGLPILLHERFGVEPRLAVAIAFGVVFVVNFVCMRLFVFRNAGSASAALGRFAMTSLMFRGAEYLAFLGLFALGLRYFVAQFIVIGLAFVIKFVTIRRFVFKDAPRGIA